MPACCGWHLKLIIIRPASHALTRWRTWFRLACRWSSWRCSTCGAACAPFRAQDTTRPHAFVRRQARVATCSPAKVGPQREPKDHSAATAASVHHAPAGQVEEGAGGARHPQVGRACAACRGSRRQLMSGPGVSPHGRTERAVSTLPGQRPCDDRPPRVRHTCVEDDAKALGRRAQLNLSPVLHGGTRAASVQLALWGLCSRCAGRSPQPAEAPPPSERAIAVRGTCTSERSSVPSSAPRRAARDRAVALLETLVLLLHTCASRKFFRATGAGPLVAPRRPCR